MFSLFLIVHLNPISTPSDALFYHSLGAFKQEVPSPTQDKNLNLKQGNANGSGGGTVLNGQSAGDLQTQHSMNGVASPADTTGNNGTVDIINSLQGHQQQMCHLQQQGNNNNASNGSNGGANGPTATGNSPGNHLNENVVNFQQMLQENNNFNEKLNSSAGRVMTPPQMDKPLLGSAFSNADARFQYVLAASTSIATKNNEDTLTYLNQGQSYEIKLKKLGDLTNYRNKVLTVRRHI